LPWRGGELSCFRGEGVNGGVCGDLEDEDDDKAGPKKAEEEELFEDDDKGW
jgi:hypothetical protein